MKENQTVLEEQTDLRRKRLLVALYIRAGSQVLAIESKLFNVMRKPSLRIKKWGLFLSQKNRLKRLKSLKSNNILLDDYTIFKHTAVHYLFMKFDITFPKGYCQSQVIVREN